MITFIIVAFIVTALSGFYLLGPFTKSSSKGPRPKSLERFIWPLAILLATGLLYLKVGDTRLMQKPLQQSDSLAAQLTVARADPSNLKEWNELGRSYLLEQQYVNAYMAYTEAEKLDTHSGDFDELKGDLGERTKWLTGLAEARILAQRGSVDSVSVGYIERSLRLNPHHPKALWYGGLAAAQSSNFSLAKDRWEQILTQNPPESVRNVVVNRLASIDQFETQEDQDQWSLKMDISIDEALLVNKTGNSRIFASLRHQERSPPLAARSFEIDDVKSTVALSAKDAIGGMANGATLDWDQPVFLSIIWSPDGQAIAGNNVKLITELSRADLDSVSKYLVK